MQQQTRSWLLLPLLALTACGTGRSADVKQSTIEQSYEVTYDEGSSQLKASASFHYEDNLGTSLKLTDGSTITFNSTPMKYSNVLNSASYNLEMPMTRTPNMPLEFRYVNNDGEVFVTEAKVPAPTSIKVPSEGTALRGDRELTVLMEGEPLFGEDEITLCLNYEPTVISTADPSVKECLYTKESLRLVFSREQLARFPRGKELTLEIKRESHPRQDNSRIRLEESFLSRPHFISLQ
ncbi:MAG TPA: hypothetical protein VFO10_25170 [Oligoflexus sp.]|uniref:hypothetical protein n=1 Tax=Oligoflexus sp. TaxID=1971216 RepID=UPI002D7FD077|nr:hypothetical protein [Oligoflexus sp.]HET9240580.1 hypothetical protein [Oligoflexus sp.]